MSRGVYINKTLCIFLFQSRYALFTLWKFSGVKAGARMANYMYVCLPINIHKHVSMYCLIHPTPPLTPPVLALPYNRDLMQTWAAPAHPGVRSAGHRFQKRMQPSPTPYPCTHLLPYKPPFPMNSFHIPYLTTPHKISTHFLLYTPPFPTVPFHTHYFTNPL